MNQSFLNPFATPAIPESVHQVIGPNTESVCLNAKFNPRGLFAGHYIASARADCGVAIYDLETKGMVRYLESHTRQVTSIDWSDSGRFLASSSLDWNVVLWDLKPTTPQRIRTIRFDAPVASVQFAPGTGRVLLVVLESQQAVVVDLRRRRRRREASVSNHVNGSGVEAPASTSKQASQQWQTVEQRVDLAQEHTRRYKAGQYSEADSTNIPESLSPITTAHFHPSGAYIIAGTTRGDVLVFPTARDTGRLLARVNISGSSAIREIAFDRSGRNLVVNSNDRSIRVVAVETSQKPKLDVQLQVVHRFQDLVNRTPWNGIGFSGDGEYVYAGAAHQAAHNVYIWDRGSGTLDKILEGPREPLVGVDWHPVRPLLLSVSVSGSINIWFTPNAENWSAYAPGFEELEENIEYQEGEEEFDLEDEDEVTRRKQDQEEVHVDVLSIGTLPGGSRVKVVPELVDPQRAGVPLLGENSVEGEVDGWEYQWEAGCEDPQESLCLHVNLEERDLDE